MLFPQGMAEGSSMAGWHLWPDSGGEVIFYIASSPLPLPALHDVLKPLLLM